MKLIQCFIICLAIFCLLIPGYLTCPASRGYYDKPQPCREECQELLAARQNLVGTLRCTCRLVKVEGAFDDMGYNTGIRKCYEAHLYLITFGEWFGGVFGCGGRHKK
jgi:hypothetical protein